jgi:hypothetical protein
MTTSSLSSQDWQFGDNWPGQRCGAKTRSGAPCKNPIVAGRKRCRMHGGAKGSGAPSGERHGRYIHGKFTKERVERIRRQKSELRAILQLGKSLGMFD